MNSTVAAVILAAGGSTRFGRPKQLLPWGGRPLVTHIADIAWSAGLDPVVVVIGSAAESVAPLLASRPFWIVHNYRWETGLSSSLNVAIAALQPKVEAALFIPVDQPLISPRLLQRFVETWQTTGAGIVVPQTPEGQRGTPVLFAREFFSELAALSGDVGGRALFAHHADRIATLRVTDERLLSDVDTPEAFETLRVSASSGQQDLDLGEIRGLICDMDGVLWRGTSPLPGLMNFFALIRDLGLEHVMVTNNSSHTPAQYVAKLAGMGVVTTEDHILSSAVATAHYVAEKKPGAAVYALGGSGVMEALRMSGLAADDGTQTVDFVVMGWDRELTWRKLATATRHILAGAPLVATNPDLTFPLEDALAPGNGAQIAALEAATGIKATVVGKPAPLLYQQALQQMGTAANETLVIGDRLDTDILGGIRLGLPTALVLTGISQRDELSESPIRPTAVFDDLPALVRAWRLTESRSEKRVTDG
ncbi:MAG: HAD-IIA family hydrolase [Anaerolineae bacterium]|jgi:4-nitrophenyl phosphatase|nr:HAD-IIA family hydrolase [Anaerolineae bacterium]